MKVFLVLCFVATAFAAPQKYYQGQYRPNQYNQGQYYQQSQYQQQPQAYSSKPVVPIVSETNEINPDGSFNYGYVTGDGQQAQAQGYLKNAGSKDAEAETIQGSYSYTAPDGTPITVTYVADEYGFRPEGAHLPTPPPIPEAIQRALAYIEQTQKSAPQSSYYQDQGQYQQQYNRQQTYRPKPFGRF